MIEINMLRLPVQPTETIENYEKKALKKKVKKFQKTSKNLNPNEQKEILEQKNPIIKSYPVEIQAVKENKDFVIAEDEFDIKLKSQIYDAQTLYDECATIRGKNSLLDDEYRR